MTRRCVPATLVWATENGMSGRRFAWLLPASLPPFCLFCCMAAWRGAAGRGRIKRGYLFMPTSVLLLLSAISLLPLYAAQL